MVKIYLVQGQREYANWMGGELVDTLEDSDLVVFEGGEDVSPFLYGEHSHPSTYTNKERDMYELKVFRKAQELGKKCLGICRGLIMWSSLNKVNSWNAEMPIMS